MAKRKYFLLALLVLGASVLPFPGAELRAADEDVARIRQTDSFVYTLEVMENGKPQDWSKTFNEFVTKHASKGMVFHVRSHAVSPSPLGDSRTVLDIGGKAQLIQITELRSNMKVRKHRYGSKGEPLYLVVQGSGITTYTKDGKESQVRWKSNDLFAVPPESWIEHALLPGVNQARLLEYVGYGVNTYTSEQMEEERTTPAEGTPQERERLKWSGHSFENLREAEVLERDVESTFKRRVIDVTPAGHKTHPTVQINEIPPGGDTKPRGFIHRHGGQATYYVLKGQGYDELNRKNEAVKKYPISEGDIIGYPPGSYYHYHFNTSKTDFFRLMPVVPRYQKEK